MRLSHKKIKSLILLLTALTLFPTGTSWARVEIGDEEGARSLTAYQGEEDYEEDSWFRETQESDRTTGPGALRQGAGEDVLSAREQGPVVEEVQLSETYHEEYETYELSMENLFFLYSNVSNGGITDKPVYVEIPINLVYSMEKDGAPIAYRSGQRVSERGTYVLRLTGVYDAELPLSEQQEYRSTFRFRIQEKPQPSQDPEGEDPGQSAADVGQAALEAALDLGQQEGEDNQELTDEESDQAVDKPADEADALEGVPSLNDMIGETQETVPGEEGGDEDEEVREPAARAWDKTGRVQEYVAERGLYLNTYKSGLSFYSSIPEGMIAGEPVELEFTGEPEVLLFRNDEPAEYLPGDGITQEGVYRLEAEGESYFFSIGASVRDMDLYRAPLGMKLKEAYLGETPIDIREGSYAFMEEDGSYRFLVEGELGDSHEVDLIRDTQAPQVDVTVKGGAAQIAYGEQPAGVTLTKNGQPLQRFSLYEVTEPGAYQLTAVDEAGNGTTVSFQLEYHFNTFAVLAFLAVAAVVAGGTVYLIKVKKSMKIR